jgi:hypothetical protein
VSSVRTVTHARSAKNRVLLAAKPQYQQGEKDLIQR